MDDLISRQAALTALGEEPPVWYDGEDEIAERDQWRRDVAAIKALPPAQPVNIAKFQPNCNQVASDCISRQAVIAEFSCCELTPDGGIDANYAIDFLKQMPSAQPEFDKQELIRTITAGIIATNTKDVYSCGMRNGMRWCISLIDGKEPEYEDIPPVQPEDVRAMCGECDAWNQYKNYSQSRWIPCSERLPEPGEYYFVTRQYFGWNCTEYREIDIAKYDSDGWHKGDDMSSITVLAWCELDVLKPWEGGQE